MGEVNIENEVVRFQRIRLEGKSWVMSGIALAWIAGEHFHKRWIAICSDWRHWLRLKWAGVSNLAHLVLHLPKLSKNARQFNWAWRKIGGLLSCVEAEMTLEATVGIFEL